MESCAEEPPAWCLQHARLSLTLGLWAVPPPPHSTRWFPRVSGFSRRSARQRGTDCGVPRLEEYLHSLPTSSPAKGLCAASPDPLGANPRDVHGKHLAKGAGDQALPLAGMPQAGSRGLRGSPVPAAGRAADAPLLYIHFQKNKGEWEQSKSVLCAKLDYAWVAWILYNH